MNTSIVELQKVLNNVHHQIKTLMFLPSGQDEQVKAVIQSTSAQLKILNQ